MFFLVILYLTVCLFACLFIFVFVMITVVDRGKLGRVIRGFISNMELFNTDIRPGSSKPRNLAFKVMISK